MSTKVSIKIGIRAIILLTVASCLYYIIVCSVKRSYSSKEVTTRKPLHPNFTFHLKNGFAYNGDLSEEFEAQSRFVRFSRPTSVFEAIESDGYTPTRLSVNIFDQNIETQAENTLAESLSAKLSAVFDKAKDDEAEESSNETTSVRFLVPNVVHYIIFGKDLQFTFTNYLSYLSVERFIQPDKIFVHGDNIPSGQWWNLTIQNVRNIYHVNRTYSRRAPNGMPFKYAAHISDYLRTEILLRKYSLLNPILQ